MSKSCPRWILQIGFLVMVVILAACSRSDVTVPSRALSLAPMQIFDQEIQNLHKRLRIPGMSVAILREQAIIFKKGFGYAESWDRERDTNGDGKIDSELCSAASVKRGEAPVVTRNWYHRGVRPECMERPDNEKWPSNWWPDSQSCFDRQHKDNPLVGL